MEYLERAAAYMLPTQEFIKERESKMKKASEIVDSHINGLDCWGAYILRAANSANAKIILNYEL